MTRIVLIRHGQTEWNRVERFRGQLDVPLNDVGRAQARALARKVAVWPVAAIYAGPLGRTQETAQPLAEALGLPVQVLDGLLDINYGQWAGRTPEEVARDEPEAHALWRSAPHLARPTGGETLQDVRDRAVAALQGAIAAHPGQLVVLVGHQVVNKVLACAVLGLDNSHFWRIRQDNACLNVFDYHDGLFEIVALNDTCHLATA